MTVAVELKAECARCGEDVTPLAAAAASMTVEEMSKALDQAMQDHVCDSRKEKHGS